VLREALSTVPRRLHKQSGLTRHDHNGPNHHLEKPFALPAASQPATAALAPMLHLPCNSRCDLQPRTRPDTRKTRRPRAATPSPPLTQPRCRPQLWPAHGQIPIADRAAPPNPYPSPRFRALALFGRRPPARVDCLSCRRPKTCTIAAQPASSGMSALAGSGHN
jgi:hypothetical protein